MLKNLSTFGIVSIILNYFYKRKTNFKKIAKLDFYGDSLVKLKTIDDDTISCYKLKNESLFDEARRNRIYMVEGYGLVNYKYWFYPKITSIEEYKDSLVYLTNASDKEEL